MKARTQELAVGVFVVLAAAALFFLAMRVSGLVSLFSNQDTYEVTAHFENVGGLSPRAKVTLSGVTIGKVRSIILDQQRLDAKVTLDIDKRYNQISTDSYASISTAGLLGEQFISLEPGADESYLKQGDEITLTQSAMVLEDLIRKFVFNKTTEAAAESTDSASQTSTAATAQAAKPAATPKPKAADTFDDDTSFGDF